MFLKRSRSAVAIIALSGLVLAGCGGTSSQPASHASTSGPAASHASTPGASASAAGSLPKVTVGYCCITPSALPLVLAQQKGMFKAAKVQVHIQRFLQGSATTAQALAAGQIDVAEEVGGPDAVLRMANRGGKIKMIATEEKLDPVWLYGKPTIKSVADLKGKTVVVGGLGGPVYTYGVLMLMSGGLSPKDVKLIQNGNNEQRTTLLTSGRAAASTVSLPGNLVAKAQGFHQLVYLGNVIKSAVEPWVASDKSLANNRTGLVRFLRAIHTAQTYIAQHPRAAAAVYAKMTKSSAANALESVKLYTPEYGWNLHMSQMLSVFKFEKKVGTWRGAIPSAATLSKYVDTSLIKSADK